MDMDCKTSADLITRSLSGNASPQDDAKSKQATTKDGAAKKEQPKPAPVKLGLHINDPRAFQGYTLLAPFDSPQLPHGWALPGC